MRLSFDPSSTAPARGFDGRLGAEPIGQTRVAPAALQRLALVLIAPMVVTTLWLGLTSDHLQKPVTAALYWSYLTTASTTIGVYWWRRRPASRFGPLLVMFGALTWIVSWQGANAPLAFDIGVLAEAPFFVLTFYLFLAFPMGRLEPPAARWLMAVLVIGVLAFFLPWALFTPVIAGGGPLTGCAAGCPANALQIGTAPTVVEIAGKAETYTALAVTLAVLVVYVRRWFSASRPQRRALAAVAVTSLLFMPAYFASNLASQILKLAPATLDVLAWCIVCTRVLLPLGFLVALLQADRFAGAALREMLERLATRPTPHEWRETVAEALDDPDLRLGYRDPRAGRFREPSGDELVPPPPATGRAWVPIDQAAEPVAAMVIDGALAEDPELVRAAGTATLVAVANGALEGALQASLQREATAGHAERVRLERDIHDSAQQRLVALRVHLGLAGERLDRSEDRALLESLNDEVERAIEELRGVTHGSAPPRLREGGLRAALLAAGARSPMRVRLHADGLTRHPEAIETTVYFCCLECLQNVARHAGPGASATVRLTDGDGRLRFVVEDDGVGFDPEHVQRGAGLRNLAERIDAGGGTLRIESRPGQGTRITGDLPQRS